MTGHPNGCPWDPLPGGFCFLHGPLLTVEIRNMKMLIIGLVLIIAALIYLAPAAQQSRVEVQRARDQYSRQLR